MKVFISWSGERSQKIGEVFRRWLPGVLQAVRPYFSPDDIARGSRWLNEASVELAASRIGLLILTPENVEAPWLLFEAGALAKTFDKARVCPLLFGLEQADIKGPLVFLQGAKFSKEEIKRVIEMMNTELGEHRLDDATLTLAFDKWWPDLESAVNKALEQPTKEKKEAKRRDRDILEEILLLTREIKRSSSDATASDLDSIREMYGRVFYLISGYLDTLTDAIQSPETDYSTRREKMMKIVFRLKELVKNYLPLTTDQ